MVSESDQQVMEAIADDIPKLSLFSLPSQPPEPPGSMSPPLRASASVPFLWEEAPGKPRRCSTYSYVTDDQLEIEITTKSLGLPPRLLTADVIKFTNLPSPTTVLDGPDVGRSLSFTLSFRSPESSNLAVGRRNGYFGSARWGSFRKSKGVSGASFYNSSSDYGTDGGEGNGVVFGGGHDDHHWKVKLSRIRRRSSFLSLSHTKSSSHLLVCKNCSFFLL